MPVGVTAWTPIANVTLASNQATVTFGSISQTYRDLILVTNSRNVDATGGIFMHFNGITTANTYFSVSMETYSTTITSRNYNGNPRMNFEFPAYDSVHTAHLFNIMDYAATDKHKTIVARINNHNTVVGATLGIWPSTTAITAVTISPSNTGSPAFASGSSFALYGVSA